MTAPTLETPRQDVGATQAKGTRDIAQKLTARGPTFFTTLPVGMLAMKE